jgi:hypothetical protein
MRKLSLATRRLASSVISAPRKSKNIEDDVPNMMLNPLYLRQSSALIQDALQKGFDVLQLASGEIITTGTKTIVYQYVWDDAKGKLVKAKTEGRKAKDDCEGSEDCEDVAEIENA